MIRTERHESDHQFAIRIHFFSFSFKKREQFRTRPMRITSEIQSSPSLIGFIRVLFTGFLSFVCSFFSFFLATDPGRKWFEPNVTNQTINLRFASFFFFVFPLRKENDSETALWRLRERESQSSPDSIRLDVELDSDVIYYDIGNRVGGGGVWWPWGVEDTAGEPYFFCVPSLFTSFNYPVPYKRSIGAEGPSRHPYPLFVFQQVVVLCFVFVFVFIREENQKKKPRRWNKDEDWRKRVRGGGWGKKKGKKKKGGRHRNKFRGRLHAERAGRSEQRPVRPTCPLFSSRSPRESLLVLRLRLLRLIFFFFSFCSFIIIIIIFCCCLFGFFFFFFAPPKTPTPLPPPPFIVLLFCFSSPALLDIIENFAPDIFLFGLLIPPPPKKKTLCITPPTFIFFSFERFGCRVNFFTMQGTGWIISFD